MDQDTFIEDARFAKVVSTKDGEAVLIAGEVFQISCSPFLAMETRVSPAELFVTALRRLSRGDGPALASGGQSTETIDA